MPQEHVASEPACLPGPARSIPLLHYVAGDHSPLARSLIPSHTWRHLVKGLTPSGLRRSIPRHRTVPRRQILHQPRLPQPSRQQSFHPHQHNESPGDTIPRQELPEALSVACHQYQHRTEATRGIRRIRVRAGPGDIARPLSRLSVAEHEIPHRQNRVPGLPVRESTLVLAQTPRVESPDTLSADQSRSSQVPQQPAWLRASRTQSQSFSGESFECSIRETKRKRSSACRTSVSRRNMG